MSDTIQIAFPKVENLVIDEQPRTEEKPVATGLATLASTTDTRKTLVCKNLLFGQTLVDAQREAEGLYVNMMDNREIVATYGTHALDDINGLIDRLLHEVEPTKIPELLKLMKNLNREMRGVRRKYDVSDPKVLAKYEDFKGGIGRFFGNARTLIELLMEDVQSLETQMNKVVDALDKKSQKLFRNVHYYDSLYDENEDAVTKLIRAIGVMELTRDVAVREAEKVVIGDSNLGDRGAERKARIAGLANLLDIQIAEYKSRLWIAWSTSPRVRMMGDLSLDVAIGLATMIHTVIPTMKATIVEWRLMMQAHEGAQLKQVVAEAQNEWITAYASAGAQVVPAIAEAVNTPTLQPAAVYAMAASIEAQTNGVIAAIEGGAQKRAELEQAIVETEPILKNAALRVSEATINQIVSKAQAPLQISTTVLPEAS